MVVSDNGTELTSNAILKWQEDRKVDWHYIAPGKPMQNGFVEADLDVRQRCRTAASPKRPFVDPAAFSGGEGQQCGQCRH